jgi:phosphatidate cytidylyltransferase
MLKNRVLTALVLAPLAIAAILLLPPDGFAVFWGAIILAAAWEWTDLAGLENRAARFGFVASILAVLGAARYFAHDWAPGELPAWFYGPVLAWWFGWGMAFRMMPERLVNTPYPPAAKLGAGAFVLISAWVMMVWLRLNFGEIQLFYLVFLIWLADVAAYFVGKRWGNTKLLELISPGKTIEGVYGALFAVGLLAVAVGIAAGLETIQIADFVFLSLLTVVVSVCGDLFESLVKRVRGVKDSSGLLPGHGGVLDRIDSLLAAVSIFYAGSLMLGIFLNVETTVLPDMSSPPGTTLEEGAPGEPVAPSEGEDGFVEEPAQGEPESPPPH